MGIIGGQIFLNKIFDLTEEIMKKYILGARGVSVVKLFQIKVDAIYKVFFENFPPVKW